MVKVDQSTFVHATTSNIVMGPNEWCGIVRLSFRTWRQYCNVAGLCQCGFTQLIRRLSRCELPDVMLASDPLALAERAMPLAAAESSQAVMKGIAHGIGDQAERFGSAHMLHSGSPSGLVRVSVIKVGGRGGSCAQTGWY